MAKEYLYKSYVTTAATIIQQYNGDIPFNDYLKKYFALHKKYGSRDRKHVTHLCYCYYRLGHAEQGLEVEERVLLALFLCSQDTHEIIAELRPEWKQNITDPLQEKLQLLGYPFTIENIFPWQEELSEGIDATAFALSHLTQPDLFLRIRRGYKQQVIQKLQAEDLFFTELKEDCIALPNNTKIDGSFLINKEVVIQDYSSQRIAEFLLIIKSEISNPKSEIKLWDCCAASGGKSLLAVDTLGNIDLTVSDVRSSIIHNLKQRFAVAGIRKYKSFVADLTTISNLQNPPFDLIIADVPCSGSGTWGRTPEQLFFFTSDKIDFYTTLQKQIVQNVIRYIKKNGYFLYVTCSVFKKENTEMVDFIIANSNLQLIKKEVLIGYDKKADTMFGALFKNPL
jgi:16S rRNA (cytosine967-C5)-methyltransferase